MTFDTLTALILFAFASSITPGPNNVMLLASGANFGLRRTVPHMLGISGGHAFMVALVGMGLLGLFAAVPWLRPALTVASVAYLLWLAWKIANAAPPAEGAAKGRPLTLLQAAAFQWVNPKAWYMAIYAQTNFAPGDGAWSGALLVALVFAAVNLPSVTVWAWGGTQLSRWLGAPGRLRASTSRWRLCWWPRSGRWSNRSSGRLDKLRVLAGPRDGPRPHRAEVDHDAIGAGGAGKTQKRLCRPVPRVSASRS
jgi:threonine/homoserine/homoserine lactone efflux protein